MATESAAGSFLVLRDMTGQSEFSSFPSNSLKTSDDDFRFGKKLAPDIDDKI